MVNLQPLKYKHIDYIGLSYLSPKYVNINNNNTWIYKAQIVSIQAESEAFEHFLVFTTLKTLTSDCMMVKSIVEQKNRLTMISYVQ